MKKYFLIACLIGSSATFASPYSNYSEYYVRADAGLGMFRENYPGSNSGKLKRANSPVVSFAIGTFFLDKVRMELMASKPIATKEKSGGAPTTALTGANSVSESQKLNSQNLMFRILPDFYDFGYGKLYGIAGLGVAMVSNSASIISTTGGVNTPYTGKTKYKINPSFGIGAGAGFFINENIMIDLSYFYLNSGSTKSKEIMAGVNKLEIGKMKINSHNIALGIRFLFG